MRAAARASGTRPSPRKQGPRVNACAHRDRAGAVSSWFETRGVAALLTMRIQDLILREARSAVSKDEATELETL